MHFPNILLMAALFVHSSRACDPAHPNTAGPTLYTVQELYPDLPSLGNLFQVSQSVESSGADLHDRPFDRVYTIAEFGFEGLGTNGCSLIFNIPRNATGVTLSGPAALDVYEFTSWPFTNSDQPTWNSTVDASPSIISTRLFGKVPSVHLGTDRTIGFDACSHLNPNGFTTLTFIFETPRWLRVAEEVQFQWSSTEYGLITGPYLSFHCPT